MYTKEQMIEFGYFLTRENDPTYSNVEKEFNVWDKHVTTNSHTLIEGVFNSYVIINKLEKRLSLITSGSEIYFELYSEESLVKTYKCLPIATSAVLDRRFLISLTQHELTKLIVNTLDSLTTNASNQHKIGDKVKVFIVPEGIESFPGFTAIVIAVHFFNNKVKYDLEIKFYGETSTRIYNIDSEFVAKIPDAGGACEVDIQKSDLVKNH